MSAPVPDKPIIHLQNVPKDTLLEIKRRNDKNSKKREWVSNVYMGQSGQLLLGEPVEGDYNGVQIHPQEQEKKDQLYTGLVECMSAGLGKDACKSAVRETVAYSAQDLYGKKRAKFGADKDGLITTIHQHPVHPFETTGNAQARQKFSGADIGSEFAKCLRDGKTRQMLLTYPVQRGSKRHNVVMNVVFPGRECYEIMKASNPHLSEQQIRAITEDGQNIDSVDWPAYQKETKKRGYVEEIDVEDYTGAEAYASYGNYYAGFAVVAVVATLAIVWVVSKKLRKQQAK